MKVEGLKPGEIFRIGNKLYVICEECGKVVQINKFLFGSLHVCENNEYELED